MYKTNTHTQTHTQYTILKNEKKKRKILIFKFFCCDERLEDDESIGSCVTSLQVTTGDIEGGGGVLKLNNQNKVLIRKEGRCVGGRRLFFYLFTIREESRRRRSLVRILVFWSFCMCVCWGFVWFRSVSFKETEEALAPGRRRSHQHGHLILLCDLNL